ncbi:MAG: glycosyltransferase [Bacteroidetes bacterium]|nr:glycosyltransferase [Bacteroidota bacterium]
MRILFISKFNWQDASPMATISTLSSWSLAQTGIPVTLLIQDDQPGDTQKILKDRFGLDSIPGYQIRLFQRKKTLFGKNDAFYRYVNEVIAGELKLTRDLVIITRNTNLLPRLVPYALDRRITLLFETHGYHGTKTLPGLPPRPRGGVLSADSQYGMTERLFLNHFHGLICITSPQQALYQSDGYHLPSVVLPLGSPGVDGIVLQRPAERAYQQKRLVYAGRYTPHLSVSVLFEALSHVRDLGIRFTWLGLKPDDFPVVEKWVKTWHLEAVVDLKPWMSHADMRTYLMTEASVGLAAYSNTFRSAAVTSPSKVFDYFSCGLPVIAPDLPTLADVLESGVSGQLYTPDSVTSLESAIRTVFQSERDYERLRDGSLRSAGQYAWLARSQRLIDFARSVRTQKKQ